MWFGIFKHSFSFSVYGKIYHRLECPPCDQIEAKINAIAACGIPPELWQDVDQNNCAQQCHDSNPSSSKSDSSSKLRSSSQVLRFQQMQKSDDPDSIPRVISVPSTISAPSAFRKRRRVKRIRTIKMSKPKPDVWQFFDKTGLLVVKFAYN